MCYCGSWIVRLTVNIPFSLSCACIQIMVSLVFFLICVIIFQFCTRSRETASYCTLSSLLHVLPPNMFPLKLPHKTFCGMQTAHNYSVDGKLICLVFVYTKCKPMFQLTSVYVSLLPVNVSEIIFVQGILCSSWLSRNAVHSCSEDLVHCNLPQNKLQYL